MDNLEYRMGYDEATTLLEGMALCEIGGLTTTHTAIWDGLTFEKIIFLWLSCI